MQYTIRGLLCVGAMLTLLTACTTTTTPTMQLIHAGSVAKTYNIMGTMTINEFLDQRSNNEKIDHITSTNLVPFGNGVVYSGDTVPDIVPYLQQTISQEAKQSEIFTVVKNNNSQYTMSGTILSLYVAYKGQAINLPVTLNGNSTPVTIGGYPSFTAVVEYHVEIYQGTQRVFSKNIDEKNTIKVHNDMTMASAQDISSQAESLLDQTVTQSVKDLFDSIAAAGL